MKNLFWIIQIISNYKKTLGFAFFLLILNAMLI